ncbi:MAG: cyclic nucleotide-binding domain-containing protein [Chloroflexi bacterium]|nr:cyclic nucleotide-binding domain-containing protein [Chloroflexota bacterium]
MTLSDRLSQVELFEGLEPDEIDLIAAICEERTLSSGHVVAKQGDAGDELFVIWEGLVEVVHEETPEDPAPRTVVNLGQGQVFGEMALVDFGPRSATVRVISEKATLQAIPRKAFLETCELHNHLGYAVMRNMAADLSFKLRHQHLIGR